MKLASRNGANITILTITIQQLQSICSLIQLSHYGKKKKKKKNDFDRYIEEFLKGSSQDGCQKEYEEYRQCVLVNSQMQKINHCNPNPNSHSNFNPNPNPNPNQSIAQSLAQQTMKERGVLSDATQENFFPDRVPVYPPQQLAEAMTKQATPPPTSGNQNNSTHQAQAQTNQSNPPNTKRP